MSSEIYPWDFFRQHVEVDPHLCFIISPIKKEFAGIRQVIEEAASELGYVSVRADDIRKPGVIHTDIWEHIQRAGAIVADITELNANVMFEVGVASTTKEKYRLIIIIRKDVSASVPFDLRPFRHIPYEDSLAGSSELRKRLRECLQLALSEDMVLTSIAIRMEEWDRSEHHYSLFVSPETLARLRGFASLHKVPPEVLAYLLASAVQNGVDIHWWSKINRDNIRAAENLVEIMLGPFVRPQFRAAYALQLLADPLRELAIREARGLTSYTFVHKLLDTVANKQVVKFTESDDSGVLKESERYELLQNFTHRVRVRLSIPTD